MTTRVSDGGADRYRRAQAGISRRLAAHMKRLRRLIEPSRLQVTVPDWMDAVRALVDEYGSASATLAADFYDLQRDAANITTAFTVPVADPPPDEQTDSSLRWAAKDLWPRDLEDAATADAQRLPMGQRLDAAEVRAEAVAQKLVTDRGRETVRAAVRRDRAAIGYARAAALGACSFCRLMGSRGMVYKTAESAGGDANSKFSGDASVVKFHDNCHCAIIPVFRGQRFELSAHAAEWDRIYREYAAPYPGDQLNRFRKAIAEHG